MKAIVTAKLFPHGFGGEDVIAEIAPDGWDRTPMVAIFHPSLEQLFQEAIESHQNLQELLSHRKRKDDEMAPVELPPTIEQVRERFQETPVDAPREVAELVGRCVWDVKNIAKCKLKNMKCKISGLTLLAFSILHFLFCILGVARRLELRLPTKKYTATCRKVGLRNSQFWITDFGRSCCRIA